MTREIASLSEIAANYDAIVLDQWGVLHDGSTPYPFAVAALETLNTLGTRLAVLSNSGKRAVPNQDRIAAMGFQSVKFEQVMTSGEALWQDVASGVVHERRMYPIERADGDAKGWADGLKIALTDSLEAAEAVLLMGLPDGIDAADWDALLAAAMARNLPLYCSNPDRASPRAGGQTVISPGALAHTYKNSGGQVIFYGKPHRPIFTALEKALSTKRLLMVGDSLEHDIAGAQSAGWDSLLVQGGLYATDFASEPADKVLARITAEKSVAPPTYRIKELA